MPSTKFVILGGGMVAGYAAKELATKQLHPGELMIVSADNSLPYERPPLSKGFLAGKETESAILINPPDWYLEKGIEVKLQTTVTEADLKNRRLRTNAGDIDFQNLLIATGARARKLDAPGSQLANVFHLRSLQDSAAIRAKAETSQQAVVIGGGFIGMEVASVLAQKNIKTTMLVREDRVWARVFTPELSQFFELYYASQGVKIIKNAKVAALEGKNSVSNVSLEDGGKFPCDMVVAGVGATPVTELFANTPLTIDNGIAVNEFLETNVPQIYAAGDVANYPDQIFKKRRRVEHWDNAVNQGQHWAQVISGDRKPFTHVPYFFSDVFDLSYELWGDSEGATQTITRGDANAKSLSTWWLKNNELIATFTMNRPDEERETAPEWIKNKQKLSPDRLADQSKPIKEAAQ